MKLIITKTPEAIAPQHGRDGDAGLDLFSLEDATILPGKRALLPTGIRMVIPQGFVGLIKDRSGVAYKQGLHTLAGVIDSNYRGDVGIVIQNLTSEIIEIPGGTKIAQILIMPVCVCSVEQITLKDFNHFYTTERGEAGYGSSDTHKI